LYIAINKNDKNFVINSYDYFENSSNIYSLETLTPVHNRSY